MMVYVVSVIVVVLVFMNYFLGNQLYKEPKNSGYFSNVQNYNIIHRRDVMPTPTYIFLVSSLLGIFLGIYCLLGNLVHANGLVILGTVLLLFTVYLIEITRKIVLNEENLEFERMFFFTKKIPLNTIDGIFIYSFNKKFLDKSALTTKLVVTSGNQKYKFTLAGIDTRAILNMMKENFGITENKIYIAKKEGRK